MVGICLSMLITEPARAFLPLLGIILAFLYSLPRCFSLLPFPFQLGEIQHFPCTPPPDSISEKETRSGITFLKMFCPLVKKSALLLH